MSLRVEFDALAKQYGWSQDLFMTFETLLPVFLQNVNQDGSPGDILDRIYEKYYLSDAVKRFLNRYFDTWYVDWLRRTHPAKMKTSVITIDLSSSAPLTRTLGKRKFIDLSHEDDSSET